MFVQPALRMSGGIAPFPRWGAELIAGGDYGPIRIFAGGAVDPTTEHELLPTGRFALRSISGKVVGCFRVPSPESIEPRLCAGLALVHLRVSPSGLVPNQQQEAWIFAPQLGGQLPIVLDEHIALTASAALQLPTTRASFVVDGDDADPTVAHRVSVGGVFSLGLEFRF